MRKIDVFNHLFPTTFYDRMCEVCHDEQTLKRYVNIPMLVDLDVRFKAMDLFGEYQQIISLASPPIEDLASPDKLPELARLANEGMAEYCSRYPDRFPSFVAALPMLDTEATLAEMDRSIRELGACGVQIYTNVRGEALDQPKFRSFFEAMVEYDLPIFLHPTRGPNFSDYAAEEESLYEIWWTFGWPYETSVAMSRLVFSGLFDRLPSIKILTHHLGGMIPYFRGRVGPGWDQLGKRTAGKDYGKLLGELEKRPYDYFKMFYADTALFADADVAMQCGLDFFGSEKVLFASDSPFDPENGTMNIRETIRMLDEMELSIEDREKIYFKNALEILRLDHN